MKIGEKNVKTCALYKCFKYQKVKHWMNCCVPSHFSCVLLFSTLWTVGSIGCSVHGFSRQECWSRLPCHSPEDLLDPGIEPGWLSLLHWQEASLAPPGKPLNECIHVNTFKHQFLWSQLAANFFFFSGFELPYFLYETLSSKFGLFCC